MRDLSLLTDAWEISEESCNFVTMTNIFWYFLMLSLNVKLFNILQKNTNENNKIYAANYMYAGSYVGVTGKVITNASCYKGSFVNTKFDVRNYNARSN